MKRYKTGAMCVQSGWKPGNGEPRVLPIYQSTTFKYESTERMARLFDLEEDGFYYTRLQNPTNEYIAQQIADLIRLSVGIEDVSDIIRDIEQALETIG